MNVRICSYCDNEALPDSDMCADCKKREETLTVDLDDNPAAGCSLALAMFTMATMWFWWINS